jgi:hypothetical protein
MFQLLIGAKKVELSMQPQKPSSFMLHAVWELDLDFLESEKSFVHSFSNWWEKVIEPLADLLQISKKHQIEALEKSLKREIEERDEAHRMYEKLKQEFETYKAAIRDSK